MRDTKAFALRAATIATAFAAAAFAFPALASAATELVEVRVEADSTVDTGTWYPVEDSTFKRVNGPDCSPRSGKLSYEGDSALNSLGTAAGLNKDLAPVTLINFDFGPQVCEIADIQSFGTFPNANGGWQYWVNNTGALSSADVAEVEDGDTVLWYFARFPAEMRGAPPVNTGNILGLEAPAFDEDGQFDVNVVEYSYAGTPTPFSGAEIEGAGVTFSEVGSGLYEVEAPPGFTSLSALDPDGVHVRSNHVEVCVNPDTDNCPTTHGRTIVTGDENDKVSGTEGGWDVIKTGSGKDKINLTGGGQDKVSCGGGEDKVSVEAGDDDDKVKGNCEKVKEV